MYVCLYPRYKYITKRHDRSLFVFVMSYLLSTILNTHHKLICGFSVGPHAENRYVCGLEIYILTLQNNIKYVFWH